MRGVVKTFLWGTNLGNHPWTLRVTWQPPAGTAWRVHHAYVYVVTTAAGCVIAICVYSAFTGVETNLAVINTNALSVVNSPTSDPSELVLMPGDQIRVYTHNSTTNAYYYEAGLIVTEMPVLI